MRVRPPVWQHAKLAARRDALGHRAPLRPGVHGACHASLAGKSRLAGLVETIGLLLRRDLVPIQPNAGLSGKVSVSGQAAAAHGAPIAKPDGGFLASRCRGTTKFRDAKFQGREWLTSWQPTSSRRSRRTPSLTANEITVDTELDDLGIHSLELTEIIFDLEEAYGIEIEMNTVEAWSKLKNVGDMVEAVRGLIADKA